MIPQTPKPFLKWAGGKSQLLPAIDAHLPLMFQDSKPLTYIEPFVGGGAVLFHLLNKYPIIEKAIINDINPHLINTYKAIKHTPDSLISLLERVQQTYRQLKSEETKKSFFLKIRELFNESRLREIEDAAYMIFLNRTCFNGLYRENSKGKFNVAFGRYANPGICDASLIRADSRLLQKVEILNGDFSQIENHVAPHTFIYCDPPYRPISKTSFTSYTKESFNDREQLRLRDFITGLSGRGCKVLLSNSDGSVLDPSNNYMDALYKDFIITRVYAKRSISSKGSNRGAIPELLIRNYQERVDGMR